MAHLDENRVHLCRVYSPPGAKEGIWILIDRLWPRGLKKGAIDFDLWLKDITPSTSLRQWFHEAPIERFNEFAALYIDELCHKKPLIEQVIEMAKDGSVTLFYAAKDLEHNHAVILKALLCSWPQRPDNIAD